MPWQTFRSRNRDGSIDHILVEGNRITVTTETPVPTALLDYCKARSNEAGRAPRGDSTACWQAVMEVPIELFLERIAHGNPQDKKLFRALVNDRDFRHLRLDGDRRH